MSPQIVIRFYKFEFISGLGGQIYVLYLFLSPNCLESIMPETKCVSNWLLFTKTVKGNRLQKFFKPSQIGVRRKYLKIKLTMKQFDPDLRGGIKPQIMIRFYSTKNAWLCVQLPLTRKSNRDQPDRSYCTKLFPSKSIAHKPLFNDFDWPKDHSWLQNHGMKRRFNFKKLFEIPFVIMNPIVRILNEILSE